eukprot:CAMPEP_0185275784 /NCGR_PEP_ID=MMETSP1359-20130426/54741_1 /TAXON_ID=552665 /ORGANISM="Bigelowiella longifila, Strain CCMP242" /LENGTH=59 /DNA_ID=CAMNT_0027869245 /DNA_START=14 /DNA_END=190 /DNA_ORIENTATION=+
MARPLAGFTENFPKHFSTASISQECGSNMFRANDMEDSSSDRSPSASGKPVCPPSSTSE